MLSCFLRYSFAEVFQWRHSLHARSDLRIGLAASGRPRRCSGTPRARLCSPPMHGALGGWNRETMER